MSSCCSLNNWNPLKNKVDYKNGRYPELDMMVGTFNSSTGRQRQVNLNGCKKSLVPVLSELQWEPALKQTKNQTQLYLASGAMA